MKKTLNTLITVCREHPQSVGQTYWQHFQFSASMSMKLSVTASAALIHAVIPALFQKTSSRSIEELHRQLHHQTTRRVVK